MTEPSPSVDPTVAIDPATTRASQGPRFGRLAGVITLWTAAWWALLGGFVVPWVPGGWWTWAGLAAVSLVVPVTVFARSMSGRLYPGALTRLLVIRPFWYLQLLVPLTAVAAVLGGAVGLALGAPGAAGRHAAMVTAIILALLGLAGWVGSRRLVVRGVEAAFPDMPPGLDGLRIVQLSDLHVGPHTSRRYLDSVVRAVRDAAPELIVFTGDQVDDYPRDTEPFARAFAGLDAPLGVYSIPGNHDIYAGWDAVRRGLEAAGQRVLVNEAVVVERNGARLWLAGTGDPAGRGFTKGGGATAAPDVERTLTRVPAGSFVVALAHNPVLWPLLAERGVQLTLSGHTHHGQLSVPVLRWSLASVFLEHAMGTYRKGAAMVYINPGTNYWGLPFRLGALPEVTVVQLRRGEPELGAETLRSVAR